MVAPLPWFVDREYEGKMWTVSASIADADGAHVAHLTRGYEGGEDGSGGPSLINAAFIVRACNSHAALVDALHDAACALSEAGHHAKWTDCQQCCALATAVKVLDSLALAGVPPLDPPGTVSA